MNDLNIITVYKTPVTNLLCLSHAVKFLLITRMHTTPMMGCFR